MTGSSRKGIVGAALALGLVLALASGAFACTRWGGRLTVWGVSPGSSGTVTAVGSGLQGSESMTYCNNNAPPTGQANVGTAGGLTRQIKLSIGVEPCGTYPGKLAPGPYNVNYLPDKSADCMSGVRMGQFTLDASGATPAGGVGPFTIPGLGSDPNSGILSTGVGGWADICIDDAATIWGNQVPIFLL